MFPMMSTIFLRETATSTADSLLFGQFEFDSLQRVKTRYGYQFYVVKWKRVMVNIAPKTSSTKSVMQPDVMQPDVRELDETVDLLNDCDFPEIYEEDGCSFLLTDENMDLVAAAFPEEVQRFWQEQVLVISHLNFCLAILRSLVYSYLDRSTLIKKTKLITRYSRISLISMHRQCQHCKFESKDIFKFAGSEGWESTEEFNLNISRK